MIVDVIAALIMLASIGIAILRGFIREVLTIFGLVGGAVAAYVGGPLLTPTVRGWLGVVEGEEDPEKLFGVVPYPLLGDILAYAAVFIVFVILLSVLSHFLAASVKSLGLGAVDRTLGMVFGIARGILFLGLLYLPIYYLVGDKQMKDGEWEWLKDSKSRVYLEATAGWIDGFIPKDENINYEDAGDKMNAMNEARKKLEDMDLLPKGEENKDTSTEKKPDAEHKEGYSEDFRDKMDKLIEDATAGGEDKPKPYNQ
tara:strand:+ start:11306 stop:12073 length:768 start_codon:yes stop_codon:yes gene_type:complete